MLRRTRKSFVGSSLRMLLVLTMTIPMAGCLPFLTLGSATRVRYIDTSCKAFEAGTYSSRDTPETREWIKSHNRAYDAICP